MTIKIEIPSDNKALAGAIGRALTEYAGDSVKRIPLAQETIEKDTGPISDNVVEIGQQSQAAAEGLQTHTTIEDSHTDQEGDDQDSTTAPDGKVDEKGVPFIPAICGNAAIPFYASGPRKGQWKKLRGVTDENYDAAYNNALAQVSTQTDTTDTGAAEETAETAEDVFGNKQQIQTQQTDVTPQQVFELYSALVQSGKVNEANGVMQKARTIDGVLKKGLQNGTIIYSAPEFIPFVYPELQALSQPGA